MFCVWSNKWYRFEEKQIIFETCYFAYFYSAKLFSDNRELGISK